MKNLASGRTTHVVAAAAVAVAAVGFFTGTSSTEPAPVAEAPPSQTGTPTPSYRDLRGSRGGPNAGLYDGAFERLRQAVSSETPEAWSDEARRQALEQRRERRAYAGAPPTIPHAIDDLGPPSCIACHGEGAKVGPLVAPKMSHAPHASCTQCHAPSVDRLAVGETMQPAPNAFTGLETWGRGQRAHAGAPPTIPHPTRMREQCDSCHGPSGDHGLKTPHPKQVSCQQCHAPSAARDQRSPIPLEGR